MTSYYIPVLKVFDDTPVLKIVDDSYNSFAESDEIANLKDKIRIKHVGHNKASGKRIAHIHPVPYPLVSASIKEKISSFLSTDIIATGRQYCQFIDVIINIHDRDLEYNLLHVMQFIECVDWKRSDYEQFDTGEIFAFDSLKLDNDKLNGIALQERRIFRLGELPYLHLFEESLVRELGDVELGVKFVPAEDWNSDIEYQI